MLVDNEIMKLKEQAEAEATCSLDPFPPYEIAISDKDKLPEKQPELIAGVLRACSKMILQGASKSYKSFLLLYLACAIACGGRWLGRECKKGRVLIINMEIERAEEHCRINRIINELRMSEDDASNIFIWNLRGKMISLDEITATILERNGKGFFDAIIIDPVYKLQSGDENSAEAIGLFCHGLDRLAEETGAAVIYCHHYSKGSKGGTSILDRSSGSGVFARDADAVVDVIQLEENDYIAEARKSLKYPNDVTAWRASFVVRSFAPLEPVGMWFRYPLHEVDHLGLLDGCKAVGAPTGNTETKRKNEARVYAACEQLLEGVTVFPRKKLVKKTGLSVNTIKACLEKSEKYQTVTTPGKEALIARTKTNDSNPETLSFDGVTE